MWAERVLSRGGAMRIGGSVPMGVRSLVERGGNLQQLQHLLL